jgi:hypothetical protein
MKSRSEVLSSVQARIRLRQLLVPVAIETTAGYRHPVVAQASNPLDDLLVRPLAHS